MIIKNGLSPSLVDDPLFRKTLVECFSCSHSLNCFCNGQTILSEGGGRADQEEHLVCDGGFFEDSWGQGFQQDEDSVRHVCGWIHSKRRNKPHQKLVEKLVDEPVDESEEEPEV